MIDDSHLATHRPAPQRYTRITSSSRTQHRRQLRQVNVFTGRLARSPRLWRLCASPLLDGASQRSVHANALHTNEASKRIHRLVVLVTRTISSLANRLVYLRYPLADYTVA